MWVNCSQCAGRKTYLHEEKKKYQYCEACAGKGIEWEEDEIDLNHKLETFPLKSKMSRKATLG